MPIVRAVLIGLLVTASASLPWSLVAVANVRLMPALPWAPAAMAIYLIFWWRFLHRWPQLRANRLTDAAWRWSLIAGGLGTLAAIALLLALLHRVGMPPQQLPDTSKYPMTTIAVFVIVGSIVAGMAEEAGFRGFMQGPLEERYGPAVAIGITSVFFGLAHLSHGWSPLRIGADIVFGAIYGLVAWASKSILPGIVLHSSFDAFQFTFAGALRTLPPGPQWFWIHLAEMALLTVAAWFAFRKLTRYTSPLTITQDR